MKAEMWERCSNVGQPEDAVLRDMQVTKRPELEMASFLCCNSMEQGFQVCLQKGFS
jgi:hypothetical protein